MYYTFPIEIYETKMMLVENELGEQFTLVKYVGSKVINLEFCVVDVYERDGKEIPAIEAEKYKVIREIESH